MIRIDTQALERFFRTDLRHAYQRNRPHDIAAAEYNLADVQRKAGRLFFHPTETPEVYWRTPLLALTAFCNETIDQTHKAFHDCICHDIYDDEMCACIVNVDALIRAMDPVDADGFTAID